MQKSRRQALQSLGLGGLALLAGPHRPAVGAASRKKLPVAAVVTTYHTNSHADVLVGKILEGWRQANGPGPDLELASLYTDQIHARDLSRGLAERHGFRIAKTIDEAVTLGGDRIAVAGVLSIGEHGNYPDNELDQKMYPRRRFLDEIIAAMDRCDQFVPIFNDKHLAFNWRDARHMYDSAGSRNIPFMAGSSLPVTWRYPAVEFPRGRRITEAMSVGYGGMEAYGFHAIESLQCLVERRQLGESGVAAITAVTGDQIWQAEKDGKWNRQLLQAALTTFDESVDRLEQRLDADRAALYLIEYNDGLRATVAMLNGVIGQFATACRIQGQTEPYASWFRLEEQQPFGHFEHLLRAIEHMVQTGQPAYPVERTLLTTGILDRVMQSLHQGGARLLSPELWIRYNPTDWGFANQHVENFPAVSR